MKGHSLFGVLAGLMLVGAIAASTGTVAGQDKNKSDTVVGARWEYTATHDNTTLTGRFRAYKRELFVGDKKIGTVQPKDEDETKLVLTNVEDSRLNGVAVLRKTMKGDNATWVGTLTAKDGMKWNLKVVIKAR